MHFKLGDSTIRYIYDTQHLIIICIIPFSDIFPFSENTYHYNIYAIILFRLHRISGPSHFLLVVICNTFVVLKTGKTVTIHSCCLTISHTPPIIEMNILE